MGGFESGEGGAGMTVAEGLGKVTKENLGDLLLLNYADFLRRWDKAQEVGDTIDRIGQGYEADAGEALRNAVGDSLVRLDPINLDLDALEEVKEDATMAFVCKSIAAARRHRVGTVGGNAVNDIERGTSWHFPGSGRVVIESLREDKKDSAIHSPLGKGLDKFKGEMRNVNLNPRSEGGLVDVRNSFRAVSVRPLIDRKNGYTATVSIRYED